MAKAARQALPYLALLLVALGLRLYRIDAQSLWADEGGTLALASREPARILAETLADVHPPLYYWLLHGWMSVAGQTAIAARGLSALCGTGAALVTILLARRWYGEAAGLAAGVVAALSPLAIDYSQEARMYALAMLLAALIFLALDHWLARPSAGRLAIYMLPAAALVGTHYFAATVVAASALVGLLGRRGAAQVWRWRAIWITAHLPLAALFLLMVSASQARLAGWTATKQAISAAQILSDLLQSFAVGLHPAEGWGAWGLLFLGLALASLLLRPEPLRPEPGWAALAWLALPVAAMVALSLGQPYYKPRFLLPALPAFQILVAAGVARVADAVGGRWARQPWLPATCACALVALLALASAAPLARVWGDPSLWRDDYRGAAQAIAASIGPDDALILNGQSQIDTLDYYLRTPQPRYLLPRVRPLDPAAVTADLAQIASQHRRVYALFYVIEESDPQGVMSAWLDERAYASGARWYGDILLRSWEMGDLTDQLAAIDQPFGARLRLARIAHDNGPLQPGDTLRVQLEWAAAAPLDGPYNLFLHLVDARGQIVAQYDGPLAAPADSQQPDQPWTRRAGLLLPDTAEPGSYRVLLGVYDPASGDRLRLGDGSDSYLVGEIDVGR